MVADFKEFDLVIFACGGFGAGLNQNSLLATCCSDLLHLSDSDGEHCIGDPIKMGEVQQPSSSSGNKAAETLEEFVVLSLTHSETVLSVRVYTARSGKKNALPHCEERPGAAHSRKDQ